MSFGSPSNEDNGEMSDINMTPLIDVMLVLLIIFIITLPVITHSVKIDLPKVSNQATNAKPEVITLSVDRTGDYYWNDNPISKAELSQRLVESSQRDPQPEIHIRGDRKAEYESVVIIMNAVQRAGLTKIGFVTDPGTPQ